MKKTLAKILGIVISLVLIAHSLSYTVFAIEETQELENEKSKNEQEIEEAKKKQEQLEAEKSETMKAVESLITQISEAESEIELLQTKITDLQAQIKTKERDIEQKEIEYNEQQKLLESRLVAIYKSGDMSYLDILLTSTSFTDFLSKYYSASELIEYDKELIKVTQEQKQQIENEKVELENNKKDLDTALAQSEQKSLTLTSLKREKENYVTQLTAEEKELQKEIEELEADNKRIQNAIEEAERKYAEQIKDLEENGDTSAGSGYFTRPVSGGYISARAYYSSGKFHGAIDYAVSTGTTVVAAADGVVMSTANLSTSYGTYVVIRHANGLQTYYCHGTYGSITVKPGQKVSQGEKIMLSGNTGNSEGPHLHFEVRKSPYNYSYRAKAYGDDSRVNPENYL